MALNSNKVQLQVTEVSGIDVRCVCPLISGTNLDLLKGQDNPCVIMIQHFVIWFYFENDHAGFACQWKRNNTVYLGPNTFYFFKFIIAGSFRISLFIEWEFWGCLVTVRYWFISDVIIWASTWSNVATTFFLKKNLRCDPAHFNLDLLSSFDRIINP